MKSCVQFSSSFSRSCRSANHDDSVSMEGYAFADQFSGTLSMNRHCSRFSMAGVMVSSPCNQIHVRTRRGVRSYSKVRGARAAKAAKATDAHLEAEV